jgi:hypothetical protein
LLPKYIDVFDERFKNTFSEIFSEKEMNTLWIYLWATNIDENAAFKKKAAQQILSIHYSQVFTNNLSWLRDVQNGITKQKKIYIVSIIVSTSVDARCINKKQCIHFFVHVIFKPLIL